MLNLLKALRQDERGVILSTEIVIIGSLLVIGLITGVACLQKSVNGELQDLAGAIGALDQSYSFSSFRKAGTHGNCCAYTAGSSYINCEIDSHVSGNVVGCAELRHVQVPACGVCGGNSTTGCLSCGSNPCGRSPCGSGPCGSAPCGTVNGVRVIETGVPGMKITEYPLSPRVEAVAPVVLPGCQDCASTEVPGGAAVQHSFPEANIVPAEQGVPSLIQEAPVPHSTPATPAPLLVPVPEESPLPPQA